MPSPFWTPATMKNSKVRPSSVAGRHSKPSHDGQDISELISEMQAVSDENAGLQIENSSLKRKISDLQKHNKELLQSMEEKTINFDKEIVVLQHEININKQEIVENGKKYMQTQKKYMAEINDLKTKLEKQKQLLKSKETEYAEKITKLEKELKTLQVSYKTLEIQSKESAAKSSEYKTKLKNAISVIQELNKVLIECTKKPEMVSCVTQTENNKSDHALLKRDSAKSTVSVCPIGDRMLEKENLLLSDIFFKPKPFVENELFSNGDGFPSNIERLL
nr:unnamed protein product [Callosobruchus analis]